MDKTDSVNINTGRKGFTLLEMMVAILLAAMVVLSLAAIFSTTFKWFHWSFRQNVIQSGTLMSFDNLSRDLQKTTFIQYPSSGTVNMGGDYLEGCTNYSSTLGAMIDTTASMRVYYYCVDGSNNMQYTWRDSTSAIACPQAPASCGAAISSGQVLQLASGVQRDGTNNDCVGSCSGNNCYFCRPANVSNQVELHYWISEAQSTSTVHINTTIATMMSLNSP